MCRYKNKDGLPDREVIEQLQCFVDNQSTTGPVLEVCHTGGERKKDRILCVEN